MKQRLFVFLTIIIFSFKFVQSGIAHVPVAGEPGETLDTALEIENPLKSLVLYDEIHEAGKPHYYTFQMEAGNRLRLILNLPAELKASIFRPILVLIGPGITNSTPAPNYLEIPTGSGYIIYDEHTLQTVYEGFTPSAFFEVLNIDTTVPETGTYYLAIYDMIEAERYALAIGFQEVFTVDEWILIAINVIAIHLWEGQNIFIILSPWILTLVLGIIFYSRKGKELGIEKDALTWMGIIAGLLFIGSGLALVFQIVWALLQIPANAQVIITIVFALFPALIGIATLKVLKGDWKNTTNSIVKLGLLSGLAIFTWAGLLIGPTLLLLVSIVGFVRQDRNSRQEIMS
ncbi:MAG: hypothetical protein ACFE9L_20885 [Candidatus Hodarchaeota archaeon]